MTNQIQPASRLRFVQQTLKIADSRRTKRPMQQTTMTGFLQKKNAAEDEVLEQSVVESNSQ